MKRILKFLPIVLGGIFLIVGFYAYMEPQTRIGDFYLRTVYDTSDEDLRRLSEHLRSTNGGYIPSTFDDFLFEKLSRTIRDSEEYRNILGFYARQSRSSRAGSNLFKNGDEYVSSIIEYGRESTEEEEQLGFLFLAYGIVKKEQAYNPSLSQVETISRSFDHIESGDYENVEISSP